MNDVKPKMSQPWSRIVCLRRAYLAPRNAAPIINTDSHASPTSNRVTLADIPNKAPIIATVGSSSAKNDTVPVTVLIMVRPRIQRKEGTANNERPQNRGLLSIGSDYANQPNHRK